MRFVMASFLWLLTTALLAVAVPSVWAQKNVIDRDGYTAFAADAAKDPRLQQAVAGELTTQVQTLASRNGTEIDADRVRMAANFYTASAAFPGQFAKANEIAHTWMFTDRVSRDSEGAWVIDLGPMLSDSSFQQTLDQFNIEPPQTLTVPIASSAPESLQPGKLRPAAVWGPLGQCRGSDPGRCLRPVDAGRGPGARQSPCRIGCLGAVGGGGGLGRIGGGTAPSQRRAQPHQWRPSSDRRRDGRSRDQRPAPVAQPDPGCRWRSGGVRRARRDAGWAAAPLRLRMSRVGSARFACGAGQYLRAGGQRLAPWRDAVDLDFD